ncbi:MAG: SDR family oxidoreductase, partial [Chloroflexota bacterium]|nr:SDR family oxidoreductase [Chloroflexota bacterium]
MAGGRLDGMVALVTGAGIGQGVGGRGPIGPGIGNGIAECLARDGAKVAINDFNPDWAAATVEQLKGLGAEAWANPGNVADPAEAKAMVNRTAEHFGQIDILVNNAGVSGPAIPVERLPVEDWLRTMGVNLTGPFLTCQAAIPLMRARQFGRIINISSLAGLRVSVNGGPDYTASKAGLLGLTRHLAIEVTQYGITVNAICPGAIVKPLRKAAMSAEEL